MGTKITDLLITKEIGFEDLSNKILVVDSFNQLYMFLTTIRQPDGSLLMDSHSNVTSHLSGLFYRFSNLMKHDIKFAFVFDGKPPKLKEKERARRAGIKHEAQLKYEEAKEREDIEQMKKYAGRTTKLEKEMIEEAKELMSAMGFPIIQAPSEGEAQAAYIVKTGKAYASLSQDADSLIFGAPLVVKNLTISGRKKKPSALAYGTILPELISLKDTLHNLQITQDQLIAISILTGTDYNIGGIKGIGPKTALKLVKEYKNNFEKMFSDNKWDDYFDFSWKEVFDLIKNCDVTDKYDLEFTELNRDKIMKIMVEKHDFSAERIGKVLDEIEKKPKSQDSLKKWF